jgi:UDP-N-acetylmuramate--alanine ligase
MNLNLEHIKTIYFIGIGGIGMSALAFHFLRLGKTVFGYDRIQSEVSSALEEKGATIEYDFELKIASQLSKKDALIIYTPAIKSDQIIYNYFASNDYVLYKRAEILGEITKDKTCIAIAGTHGKTTISAMLAFLLKENNESITAFLGGISQDYQSNYIYSGDEVIVVEADEYDRSLLKLYPNMASVSNIDADHLDIYNDKNDLEDTFKVFANRIKDKSKLFHQKGLNLGGKNIQVHKHADYYAENLKIENGIYHFDWVLPHKKVKDVKLQMPGQHNLFNALTALALASASKPEKTEQFAKSLAYFSGVKRRFNYIIKEDGLNIIDDYAHHPSEIDAVHHALAEMYPDKKLMVIFQPHLYSRTRDFADEFAMALNKFDSIKLLEIYPAREKEIEGVNALFLCNKIDNPDREVIKKQDILSKIRTSNCEVVALLGAGDIGLEANRLKHYYNHEK